MSIILKLNHAISQFGVPRSSLSGDMKTTVCIDTRDGNLYRFLLSPGKNSLRLDQLKWTGSSFEFKAQMMVTETEIPDVLGALLPPDTQMREMSYRGLRSAV